MNQHHPPKPSRTINDMIQGVSAILAVLITFFIFPFLHETTVPYIMGFVREYYAWGYDEIVWWLWAGLLGFGSFYVLFAWLSARLTMMSVKRLRRSMD